MPVVNAEEPLPPLLNECIVFLDKVKSWVFAVTIAIPKTAGVEVVPTLVDAVKDKLRIVFPSMIY